MTEAKIMTEELKTLIAKTDSASEKRKDEIAEWFRTHDTDENVKLFQEFLDNGFDELKNELSNIAKAIEAEMHKKECS